MTWIAVNKDGTELISNSVMGRASEWLDECMNDSIHFAVYRDECSGVWANNYTIGYFKVPTFDGVVLPKGTIKILSGKDMTWDNEPIQIEDYD